MNWEPLIDIIVSMIKECLAKNKTEEEIIAQFRDPGPVAQFLLERRGRKSMNLTRRQWRKEHGGLLARGRELPEEVIKELIAEAREAED
jgi:hypothetical protein